MSSEARSAGTGHTGASRADRLVCDELARCEPSIGRTLGALSRTVDRALGEAGLSLGQYRALGFLADEKTAAAASRLADKLAVSRPTITALVDGLVSKRWVERQVAEGDRRRVDHVLTPAGRKALARADRAVVARLGDLAGRLDVDERSRAIDGLALWGLALEAARAERLEELAR